MAPTPNGLAPKAGFLAEQLTRSGLYHQPDLPDYTLMEYDPVLDSCNLDAASWQKMVADIQQHQHAVDGIVLLHGTDTLAYSASMLAFALGALACPVIITGSQRPMAHNPTDAHNNVLLSMRLAATSQLNEVCVCFDGVLLRGCRSTKVDANQWRAFDSPNAAALFEACANQSNLPSLVEQHTSVRALVEQPFSGTCTPTIRVLTLLPGQMLTNDDIQWLTTSDAIIMRTFGAGNAPQRDDVNTLLLHARDHGVCVVNLSQCSKGAVDMGSYQTGQQLQALGVISGSDMTLEACYTKLWLLLHAGIGGEDLRAAMIESYCGELS